MGRGYTGMLLWVGVLVAGVIYIQPDLVNSIQRDFETFAQVYRYAVTLGGL